MAYDAFVSYSWRDRPAAERLARRLDERGLQMFLDRWYLTPGTPWVQALEERIADSRAAVVLIGPEGLGQWQQRERDLALGRQARDASFPVIPVLLPKAEPPLGFLGLNTWVDLRSDTEDPTGLRILEAAIRGESPGPDVRQVIEKTRAAICPYRGLRPFREEDAEFFFGREAFVALLTGIVGQRQALAIVGASGSGKSSVARAGLLPHLRRQGAGGQVWEILTVVPGAHPLRTLAAAALPLVEPNLGELDRLLKVIEVADHLEAGRLGLGELLSRALELQHGSTRILLLVDQMEEAFTLCTDPGLRRRFIGALLDACRAAPVTLLFTLRGDFFGRLLEDRGLVDALQGGVVNLGPLTPDELHRVVEMPARRVGLEFEAGLVSRITTDVGDEPGNLPLLEFVLEHLWQERSSGHLHHAAYEALHGIKGAIAHRAEALFTHALGNRQQTVARRLLLQLVRAGHGTADTRRRMLYAELEPEAGAVLEQLVDARLLVTGWDAATGQETIDVAHEALIEHWDRLRGWIQAEREFLIWRAELESLATRWERSARDPGTLLTERPLAEADRLTSGGSVVFSEREKAFLEASRLHQRGVESEVVQTREALRWSKVLRGVSGFGAATGVLWAASMPDGSAIGNAVSWIPLVLAFGLCGGLGGLAMFGTRRAVAGYGLGYALVMPVLTLFLASVAHLGDPSDPLGWTLFAVAGAVAFGVAGVVGGAMSREGLAKWSAIGFMVGGFVAAQMAYPPELFLSSVEWMWWRLSMRSGHEESPALYAMPRGILGLVSWQTCVFVANICGAGIVMIRSVRRRTGA